MSRDLGLAIEGAGTRPGCAIKFGAWWFLRQTHSTSFTYTEGRKPVHRKPQSLFHRYRGKGGPRPGSACADSSPAEGRKEEATEQRGTGGLGRGPRVDLSPVEGRKEKRGQDGFFALA